MKKLTDQLIEALGSWQDGDQLKVHLANDGGGHYDFMGNDITDSGKHEIARLVSNAVQQWCVIGAGGGKVNVAFFSDEDAAIAVFERWRADNAANPAVKVHLMAVIDGWVPLKN